MTATLCATPVTAQTWSAFAAYFTARGGPGYCWCMAFRAGAAGNDAAARRDEMARRVAAGEPVGILLSDGDATIGWCSVAPRESYRGIGGPAPAPGDRVWTIGCLHLRRDRRGQGLSAHVITAAEAQALAKGATVIEATPVVADSPSYRFMGRVSTFRSLGYEEVGMAGTRRHVMRKRIGAAP